MKYYRALVNGREVAEKIEIADGFFSRLRGLLKREELEEGEGLLLSPYNQIHTIGMKFDIDALFISKSGEIIYLKENMEPGNVSKRVAHSHRVLELRSGSISYNDIKNGDRIAFDLQ